jgi:hypothetical protein
MEPSDFSQTLVVGAGCATVVLGSALAFAMMKKSKNATRAVEPPIENEEIVVDELDKEVRSIVRCLCDFMIHSILVFFFHV